MQDRIATQLVDRDIVAIELGGAGDAQPFTQAREHQFVLVIDQAYVRRGGGIRNRDGDRIALGRVNRQSEAERPRQQRAVAAERDDIGVGGKRPGAFSRVPDVHVFDAITVMRQLCDRRVIQKIHAARRT